VRPTRLLRFSYPCFAAAVLASAMPTFAQTYVPVGHDPIYDQQDTPWGLPNELLERLADQAEAYGTATMNLTFRESTQRLKYPRGRINEGAVRQSDYVFTLDDGVMVSVPAKGHGSSTKRYGKSKAPPAHAWMQLFSGTNQPYFAFRDLGEVPHAFGKARKIQFRGSLPYDDGADIRQWEGTVLIDSYSLQLLELDAEPLHLWPRLEQQRRKYVQSFKLVLFVQLIRFKKRPIAERVHVRFDVQPNGMWLPADSDVERFELVAPDRALMRSRLVKQFEYDFDDTRDGAAEATGSGLRAR